LNKNKIKEDRIFLTFLVFTIFLLFSSSVLAIGIRPAKTTLKEIPNSTQRYPLFIMNDEGKDIDVKVYSEGPLSSYVVFDRSIYHVGPNGREIYFTLELPRQIPPGENVIDVVVEPQELWLSKNAQFSAKLKLIHKVFISGEIPDKYIKANLIIEDHKGYMEIKSTIQNRGRETINFLKAIFTIKDETHIIEEIDIPSKGLARGGSETFSKRILTVDYTTGEYQLNALIKYDDQSLSLSKLFKVGEPNIDLRKWDEYLKFDDINEFSFELQSKWNRAIQNINVQIDLFRNRQKIKSSKTEMFTLEASEQKQITNFIDVRGLATGIYNAVMTIQYLDKTAIKEFEIEILADNAYQKKSSQSRNSEESDNRLQYIILLILTINISAMVLIMVMNLRNKRRPQEPDDANFK